MTICIDRILQFILTKSTTAISVDSVKSVFSRLLNALWIKTTKSLYHLNLLS